jgi:hypothetical protein
MSAATYVMCILLCEFLWWLHYSFPQNMVDNVRAWPEYHELLKTVQEMFVDVHHIFELLRELYWRGNVLNNRKHKRNSLSVPSHASNFIMLNRTKISYFKWQTLIAYHKERNRSSVTCRTMPGKCQKMWPAPWVRSKPRTSWILSWNDKYTRVTFGL